MYRIVFFDIDGTLLDGNILPDTTKIAVQKLKETGVIVCLATGRSEAEAREIKRGLGIDWAVTCNGAHVGFGEETVIAHAFPEATAKGVLDIADRHGHSLHLYAAYGSYITRYCETFREIQQRIGLTEPNILSKPMPFYQMIVFCTEEEEKSYRHSFPELIYHRWDIRAVDLNPEGVNKGRGVTELLAHLNIQPEEAIAFGDGNNDFSMFAVVGTSVAMGNAVPDLKECATYTTLSVGEHGIAHALTELLGLIPKDDFSMINDMD